MDALNRGDDGLIPAVVEPQENGNGVRTSSVEGRPRLSPQPRIALTAFSRPANPST